MLIVSADRWPNSHPSTPETVDFTDDVSTLEPLPPRAPYGPYQHSPTKLLTISCFLCNDRKVANTDEELIEHFFSAHSEQDALFAMESMGMGTG
jgi:hypothetical protein